MRCPEEHDLMWQVVARTEVSNHRVFRLKEIRARHVSSGNEKTFSVISGPDWVNVICLTTDKQVVLVRQYRAGVDAITLELPGGVIDPGELPLEAARRELREETGYEASRWVELGSTLPNPAIQSNSCHMWLATDAAKTAAPSDDPDERIGVVNCPLGQVPKLIMNGEITHALVLAAFARFMLQAGGFGQPPYHG